MSDRKVSPEPSPMEDQGRPKEAHQTPPPRGFAGSRRVTEHLAVDRTQEGADELTSSRKRAARENQDTVNEFATVVFKNHVGDRYVWPFERCRSFDTTKSLIEEVYALSDEPWRLESIRDGNYIIQNESGAVILPTVWDSIVRPHSTIQIEFRRGRVDHEDFSRRHPFLDEPPEPEVIEIIRPRKSGSGTVSGHEAENDKSNTSDSDSGLSLFSEEEELSKEQNPSPLNAEPYRVVSIPTDSEGNKLSFKVNTNLEGPELPPKKTSGSDDAGLEIFGTSKPCHGTTLEHVRITKAISTQLEGKSLVQVHTLSGPDNTLAHNSTSIDWYHIHSERLDYARFKEVCLGVPGLSVRLEELTKKLLEKVEKEHVEAFLNGMFVKPGTVLRGDESHQPDPQSVIFSCIPYFDLQPAVKRSSVAEQSNRLFPPRTLMQSYYPYEPVQERDAEQAYRKFRNEHLNALIHVPNMWMMNIGSGVVVTCGHQPLSRDFVKSIDISPVDLAQLQTKKKNDTIADIRLTDWSGRRLLFSPKECRSYFQVEQKLKEIENLCYWSNDSRCDNSLQLVLSKDDGSREMVTPRSWSTVIRGGESLFIDLTTLNTQEAAQLKSEMAKTGTSSLTSSSVPPFFYWPLSRKDEQLLKKDAVDSSTAVDEIRMTRCLELAEKVMLTEILDEYAINDVEAAFTSTDFYRALPESTYKSLEPDVASLRLHKSNHRDMLTPTSSHHQTATQVQHNLIAENAYEFHEIAHATIRLFVADVDKSPMLRKLWTAMSNACKTISAIQRYDAKNSKIEDHSEPNFISDSNPRRAWYVRGIHSNQSVPEPAANDEFKHSLRKCWRCYEGHAYDSLRSVTEHLQKHLKLLAPSSSSESPTEMYNTLSPQTKVKAVRQDHDTKDLQSGLAQASSTQNVKGTAVQPNLEDWIFTGAQKRREEWNEGSCAILTKACEAGQRILDEAREIVDGVCNEDGAISELYTFPRALVRSFRQIVVFYLAIERALHYTEELYQGDSTPADDYRTPFTHDGLQVLEKFANGAQNSLSVARNELCTMARSNQPMSNMSRLSLGPEYLCSWFIRRLLVKPLEKSMAVSDMYREYLSTIQFQVNHRPGKRLLRSINLLQEELNVLLAINKWQMRLITNYSSVLHDATYEKDIPLRRSMYPYERQLLTSCLEHLALMREDYNDQIRRCGPLSESTKQSLEINEEDHGKAIMIFTIVTIIFLPLSFVTSYLGMNTSDIRDMESRQTLFWTIAIPLTTVTLGTILFISYNGDELCDTISAAYRTMIGKQNYSASARGISIAQRKRARNFASSTSILDEAEYADPSLVDYPCALGRSDTYKPPMPDDTWIDAVPHPERIATYDTRADASSPPPRMHRRRRIDSDMSPVNPPRRHYEAAIGSAATIFPPPPPRPRMRSGEVAEYGDLRPGARHVYPDRHYSRLALDTQVYGGAYPTVRRAPLLSARPARYEPDGEPDACYAGGRRVERAQDNEPQYEWRKKNIGRDYRRKERIEKRVFRQRRREASEERRAWERPEEPPRERWA